MGYALSNLNVTKVLTAKVAVTESDVQVAVTAPKAPATVTAGEAKVGDHFETPKGHEVVVEAQTTCGTIIRTVATNRRQLVGASSVLVVVPEAEWAADHIEKVKAPDGPRGPGRPAPGPRDADHPPLA